MNSCSWLFYKVKQTHCELFHRNNFIGEDPLGTTSVQVKASKPETCHKGGTTGTQLSGEGKNPLLIWVYLLLGILVQGWHCWLGFLIGKCGVSWAEAAQPCPCLPGLLLLKGMMSLPLSYFFWPGCPVFLQQDIHWSSGKSCGNLGSCLQAVNDLNFVSYRSKKSRG